MFFVAYTFKGHVHVFAGRVKVVSHLSCRASAIFLSPENNMNPDPREQSDLGLYWLQYQLHKNISR